MNIKLFPKILTKLESFSQLNIKARLFFWFILVSVIPIIATGGFSYYLISEKISKQNQETITNVNQGIYNMVDIQQKVLTGWLDSSVAFVTAELSMLGKSRFDYNKMVDVGGVQLPTWYIGKQKITNDFTLVDNWKEKNLIGATIFQFYNNKFIRVSTNVRKPDGTRIMHTLLESPGPVYDRLIAGQSYQGRVNVEGDMWATVYHPLRNAQGKLIGAVVIGRKEQGYELINAIKNIIVGETGYVFVLDDKGNAIIHPSLQGKNLLEYPYVKEILQRKTGFITYNHEGRDKIAHFVYYEPWNWYIVTGSYASEIFTATRSLSRILILIILLAIGISALIALVLSTTFSRPINQLARAMRQAQSGNLSAKFTYVHDDEFRVLSDGFNTMLDNISLLISRILANSTKLKEASQRLIVDINESKQSLRGIAVSVDNLRQEPVLSRQMNASVLDNDTLKECAQAISDLRQLIEDIGTQSDYKINAENALQALDCIDALYEDISNASVENQIMPHASTPAAISYLNKINSFEVEVQKLKLLLKNICSSASSLDDIALSLDRHVNVFKINHPE